MLILNSTTDLLQIVTSAATAVDVHSSWVDYTAPSTQAPDRKNTAITTATTTTIVGSPTIGVQRNVKTVNVRNKSATTSNTVTVTDVDATNTVTAELFSATLYAGEELVYVEGQGFRIYDAAGNAKQGAVSINPRVNDFRLTGVTATPVMIANSTTLSTLYLTPFHGNNISLYDGTNWQLVSSVEVSIAVTGRTTDLPFDIFAYSNAGVVTLELLDWTSSTARATDLTRVNGVWTKSSDSSRRYVGSVRARSATTFHWVMTGTDLPCKFDLFNADNRVEFNFALNAVSPATWAYTVATIRQAQASANYQVDIMVGLQEECFGAILTVNSANSTISIGRAVGIGFDSTSTFSSDSNTSAINTVASIMSRQDASISDQPAIGRHIYSWNESSVATGTCTFTGTSAIAGFHLQSGMTGDWTC